MTIEYTPAGILLQALIAGAVIKVPNETPVWSGYVKFMPTDDEHTVTFYDTEPEIAGRVIATGETVRRWGVMARSRCGRDAYNLGWGKLRKIENYLTNGRNRAVSFPDARFVLHSVSVVSGPMFVGEEPETKRCLFSLNLLASIRAA